MANDLELIKELEKEIGQKLPLQYLAGKMAYGKVGYAAGARGRVTGINLFNMNLKKIPALLSRFKHLKSLRLSFNQISDIKPLEKLMKLTNLCLKNNQISDISPLTGLTSIKRIDLVNNKISTLPWKIRYFKLDHDLGEKYATEDKIYLYGNPVARYMKYS